MRLLSLPLGPQGIWRVSMHMYTIVLSSMSNKHHQLQSHYSMICGYWCNSILLKGLILLIYYESFNSKNLMMHVLFLLFHSSTADRENVFVILQLLCQHHCQETQVRLYCHCYSNFPYLSNPYDIGLWAVIITSRLHERSRLNWCHGHAFGYSIGLESSPLSKKMT